MFSHMMVGSNDLDRSKRFYDATFTAIGGGEGAVQPSGRLIYPHRDSRFLVTKPIDGEPASPGNGMTIGFVVDDVAQVDAWHAAGVATGGTAVEDAPGLREMGPYRFYLAYLRDPDGNKLCAFHDVSEK